MATYINSGTGYYRATDPDMVFSSSLNLNDTMAPGGSTGHPYLYGPCYGIAPRFQSGFRHQPRSLASVWAIVATWTTDFNADLGYSWAMDLDMSPDRSWVWLTF